MLEFMAAKRNDGKAADYLLLVSSAKYLMMRLPPRWHSGMAFYGPFDGILGWNYTGHIWHFAAMASGRIGGKKDGVARRKVAWHGMARRGMAWHGIACYGMEQPVMDGLA